MSVSITTRTAAPEMRKMRKQRLAVILSHPVQYYSPWFQYLNDCDSIELHVFYLWNRDECSNLDRGFGVSVSWDIPLLKGYSHEFVPNVSSDPGTHHFRGLINPELASRIAEWNPDAVLCFGYAWQAHVSALLSPALRKIPFLFRGDSHELYPAPGIKQHLSRQLRRLIFRRIEGFLAVGRAHQDYLRMAGVPDRKIVFAPHCVDNARFSGMKEEANQSAARWKTELGISENRSVLLFVGKFENKKRPQDLLDAFLSLEASDLPSSPALLFVGNGGLEKDLRNRAGEEIGRNVFFAPFQNQTEMPKVYATGDVLVLPSFGRGETWGLVVNEAMNLGTPAIVSSHVGCGADLVQQGKTGWIFEAGNQDHLQEILATALSDPAKLKAAGDAAQSHIQNYSYEAATNGLLQSMNRICAR